MPRLNCFDLMQQLQNDARLKLIDVILISSVSEEFLRMMTPQVPIGTYMSKPYRYNECFPRLNEIL